MVRCMVFLSFAGIVVKARFKGSLVDWHCLNVYTPYLEREFFWNQVIEKFLLKLPNLIVVGNLNLMTSSVNISVCYACCDPLGMFFNNLIVESQLVDI